MSEVMAEMDPNPAHDKLQATDSSLEEVEGVSPGEFIAMASAGGLLKPHVEAVLQAAGFSLEAAWESDQGSQDLDLMQRFKARAIKVTAARQALSGTLMERSQQNIQIITNERTKQQALLLSRELLEEVLKGQAKEMAEVISRLNDQTQKKDQDALAAQSRQSFLELTKSMETISAPVPIVKGSKAAANVALRWPPGC